MRHLGEGVDHRRAIGVGWLGGGQHGQAQGHRPAHRHVAVLEDVVEVADGHLSAQLLPPRHQRDPERGNRLRVQLGPLLLFGRRRPAAAAAGGGGRCARAGCGGRRSCWCCGRRRLVLVVVILLQVLAGQPEEALHLEHVASAGVGARLEGERAVGAHLPRHRLGKLQRDLDLPLPAHVQQPGPDADQPSERVLLQRGGIAFHEHRHERLGDVLVAGAREDETEGQGSHRDDLERGVEVRHDRHQQLEHLLLGRADVCEPQPEHRAHLELRVGLARFDVLCEQRQRRLALVADARVEDAHRQQRAGLDVDIRHVQELVDLGEPAVYVPSQQRAQRGCGRHHAMLLVLVQPLVALGQHELVGSEAEVHKGVDEGGGQVGAGRVDGRGRGGSLLEVGLINVVGSLWLEHVEVARQLLVVLGQVRAVHQAVELLVQIGADALPREHQRHLLGDQRVLARAHDLGDRLVVLQPKRQPQRLGVLAELAQHRDGHLQHLRILRLRHVLRHLQEVHADAVAVGGVHVRSQCLQLAHLHQQVDGLRLGVVLNKEGHHLVHHKR
mmetsp:Transcript_10690/g.34334  ORF Transcript_10690/g.34334 Transcript_10690/m.34334 type:complete len:555 (-) Transcript_10690:677-2341(-)